MNLAEHIRDLENTRAAKVSRMEQITQKTIDESRSFDATEVDAVAEVREVAERPV